MEPLDAFIRVVRWLSRVTGVAAALLIALAVLVICDMVIERYVFNLNTIWQIDFVTYAIVGATFIGSPYVLMHRGHVNVDILPMHSGPRFRYWLALSTALLSLAFCAVLWWLCTRFWRRGGVLALVPREQPALFVTLREHEEDERRSQQHGHDAGCIGPLVPLEERRLRPGDDLVLDRRRIA